MHQGEERSISTRFKFMSQRKSNLRFKVGDTLSHRSRESPSFAASSIHTPHDYYSTTGYKLFPIWTISVPPRPKAMNLHSREQSWQIPRAKSTPCWPIKSARLLVFLRRLWYCLRAGKNADAVRTQRRKGERKRHGIRNTIPSLAPAMPPPLALVSQLPEIKAPLVSAQVR